MGKKNKKKKIKKIIPKKTREERVKEINKAKLQLNMLDLGIEIPGIKEAYKIFDKYIEDGLYVTGKIKLEGCKRILKYMLFEKQHSECAIMLQYNNEI